MVRAMIIRYAIIILLIFASCKAKKQISSSQEDSNQTVTSITSTNQTQKTNEQQSTTSDSRENLDTGTIITFDGPGKVTISPSGAIEADGTNARVHTFDRSIRQQKTETAAIIETEDISTADTIYHATIEQTKTESSKAVKRSNMLPFLIPVFVCLIICSGMYLLWKKYT
jgi:Ca2+/Na+ antiporter